jgi:hypothetical protein
MVYVNHIYYLDIFYTKDKTKKSYRCIYYGPWAFLSQKKTLYVGLSPSARCVPRSFAVR